MEFRHLSVSDILLSLLLNINTISNRLVFIVAYVGSGHFEGELMSAHSPPPRTFLVESESEKEIGDALQRALGPGGDGKFSGMDCLLVWTDRGFIPSRGRRKY